MSNTFFDLCPDAKTHERRVVCTFLAVLIGIVLLLDIYHVEWIWYLPIVCGIGTFILVAGMLLFTIKGNVGVLTIFDENLVLAPGKTLRRLVFPNQVKHIPLCIVVPVNFIIEKLDIHFNALASLLPDVDLRGSDVGILVEGSVICKISPEFFSSGKSSQYGVTDKLLCHENFEFHYREIVVGMVKSRMCSAINALAEDLDAYAKRDAPLSVQVREFVNKSFGVERSERPDFFSEIWVDAYPTMRLVERIIKVGKNI